MAALAQGRAKREQKPVERLTAAADEKEDKALEIPQGSGSRLGDRRTHRDVQSRATHAAYREFVNFVNFVLW